MKMNKRRESTGNASNPIKSDPQLRALLKRLGTIHKYKTFHRWKKKFLDRLLPQLVYEKGMTPAKERCDQFSKVLDKAAKQADKVAHHLEEGELTSEKTTVKARLALQEFANQLTITVEQLADWIPTSVQEEKRMKYTKFHLGASLIQQGFHHYITMKQMEDAIQALLSQIGEAVLDKQQTELFDAYHTQVERFSDVMADLNLYEVMKKCLEFATAPEVEESSDEEAIVIEIINGADNRNIQLEVQPSDMLASIKETIADAFDIPTKQQVLSFKDSKQVIESPDSATLSAAGIQDKAKLVVKLKMIDVTVQTMDGTQSFSLQVEPTSETIGAIQNVIAGKLGMEVPNQILTFKGKPLVDPTATVAQEGIPHGSQLIVQPRKVPVMVHTYDGKKIKVIVDPADVTLEDMKALVEPESGIAPSNQRLFHKEKRDEELLGDLKTLADHGIGWGTELYMEPRNITIHVDMPDEAQSFDMEVALSDTTQEMQSKIDKKTGMPVPEQIVTYKNKEMPPTATAKALGLQNGDTIQVKYARMPVTVKRKKDNTIVKQVMVDRTDTLMDLRKLIAEASGVNPGQQVLSLENGQDLSGEDKSVLDLGIRAGSIILLGGKIVISSSGDVYVSLTVEVQDEPSKDDYDDLAKVVAKFYTARLKNSYPESFQDVHVTVHRALWQAGKPSTNYNVYVEWDLAASFDMSGKVPDRNTLCGALANANLFPLLQKLVGMPKPPFSCTKGAYTKQTL